MAEPHVRVLRSIWTNEDWLDLSVTGQWLYQRLLSHDKFNYAGVIEWKPRKLTQSAVGASLSLIQSAADELAEGLFVVFDDDTEECLIRSFVRNDELLKQPNMAVAVAKGYANTGSRKIRGVIVHELLRLQKDQPGLRWENLSAVLEKPSIDPRTTLRSVA